MQEYEKHKEEIEKMIEEFNNATDEELALYEGSSFKNVNNNINRLKNTPPRMATEHLFDHNCTKLEIIYDATERELFRNTERLKEQTNEFQNAKYSADAGYAGGKHNLAEFYVKGWGVVADFKKALSLWKEAADAGYSPSCFKLTTIYKQKEYRKNNDR